jgi:hypothetical protein
MTPDERHLWGYRVGLNAITLAVKKKRKLRSEDCPFHGGGHVMKDDQDMHRITVPEMRRGWMEAVSPLE